MQTTDGDKYANNCLIHELNFMQQLTHYGLKPLLGRLLVFQHVIMMTLLLYLAPFCFWLLAVLGDVPVSLLSRVELNRCLLLVCCCALPAPLVFGYPRLYMLPQQVYQYL